MTKYSKVLRVLFYIFGTFSFVAFLSYFLKLFIWTESLSNFLVCFIFLLLTGIPLLLRKFFIKLLNPRLFKVLETIYTYATAFYTVTFIALVIFVFSAKYNQPQEYIVPDNSVAIVFGAGIRGENPGNTLKRRLNKTVEFLEENDSSICVVTGGQGKDEIVSEASVMAAYLVNQGIDKSRIIVEDKASNTIENIQFSIDVLNKNNISYNNLYCISSAFHMPRIKLICQRMSVKSEFVFADNDKPYSLYSALVREYLAYAKLFLLGVE